VEGQGCDETVAGSLYAKPTRRDWTDIHCVRVHVSIQPISGGDCECNRLFTSVNIVVAEDNTNKDHPDVLAED